MPRMPSEFKDEVKHEFGERLVSLIKEQWPGLFIRRIGGRYECKCPFHDDSTPSFHIRDGDSGWHYWCDGCKRGGDVYAFLRETQGMEFLEAVRYVAGLIGREVPVSSAEDMEQMESLHRLREIVLRTARICQNRLYRDDDASARARKYLKDRGVTDDLIKEFGIGYAPEDPDFWRGHCADLTTQFRFASKELTESGVFMENDAGRLPMPLFRGRIMFPIHDAQGRPVGFAGRRLSDEDSKIPKYINSPECPIFRKGSLLFNHHRARADACRLKQPVVVVEGYLDAIAMHAMEMRPVVSVMGTAVTRNQLEAVWRIGDASGPVNAPVFCLDGDESGRRASESVASLSLPLITPSRYVEFAVLTSGDDPASMIGSGRDGALAAALNQTRPAPTLLFDGLVERGQPLATPEVRAQVEAASRDQIIALIADPSLKRQYKVEFYRRMRELTAQVDEAHRWPGDRRQKHRINGPLPMPSLPRLQGEAGVLAALLTHPVLLEGLVEELSGVRFAEMEALKQDLIMRARFAIGQASDQAELGRKLGPRDDDQVREIAAELLQEHPGLTSSPVLETFPFAAAGTSDDDARKGVQEVLRRMLMDNIREDVRRLSRNLGGVPEDAAMLGRVTRMLDDLKSL